MGPKNLPTRDVPNRCTENKPVSTSTASGRTKSAEALVDHRQTLDSGHHRDRRRDHAVAIEKAGSDNRHDDRDRNQSGTVRESPPQQGHQRQDATLAVVVGPHDKEHIAIRDHDRDRPKHHRDDTEHVLAGGLDGVVVSAEDRLQRVQRAGADIAEHHTQCGQRQGPQSTMAMRRVLDRGRGSARAAADGSAASSTSGRLDSGVLVTKSPVVRLDRPKHCPPPDAPRKHGAQRTSPSTTPESRRRTANRSRRIPNGPPAQPLQYDMLLTIGHLAWIRQGCRPPDLATMLHNPFIRYEQDANGRWQMKPPI